MTLGGLALAIGLLVDNATVTIENIHRNQTLGKPLTVAILDGSQRGDPAADRGDAGDLHRVLPGACCCSAWRASCSFRWPSPSCSACWRPTCCRSAWCRRSRASCWHPRRSITARRAASSAVFDRGFDRFRDGYGRLLEGALHRRVFVLVCAGGLLIASPARWRRVIGTRLLPDRRRRPDQAALPRARRHAARGDRGAGAAGRGQHPPDHPGGRAATPSTTRSACRSRSTWPSCRATTSAAMDAEILISLKPGHRPSIDYIRAIRAKLPRRVPRQRCSISRPPTSSARC